MTREDLEPARGNLHVCKFLRDLTIIQIRTVTAEWAIFVLSEKGESVIQNTLLLLDYMLRNVKIVFSVGLCFLFNFKVIIENCLLVTFLNRLVFLLVILSLVIRLLFLLSEFT